MKAETIALVDTLHEADFRRVVIESSVVPGNERWERIVVDEAEIGGERMRTLLAIASDCRAVVTLLRFPDVGGPSRIMLWPQ